MQVCAIKEYFNDSSAEDLFHLKTGYGYGNVITRQKISFLIDGNVNENNICCLGQKIDIGQQAGVVWVLGYCEMISLKAELAVDTDKGITKAFLEFPCSDGMKQIGCVFDRKSVLESRNTIVYDAVMVSKKKNFLFACKICTGNQFIQTITLPDYEMMHVLAITVEKAEEGLCY